ncbi:MAG: hypothetical protein V1746_03115 [bacterium]
MKKIGDLFAVGIRLMVFLPAYLVALVLLLPLALMSKFWEKVANAELPKGSRE